MPAEFLDVRDLSAEEVDRVRLRALNFGLCTLTAVSLVAACLATILATSPAVNAERPSQAAPEKVWSDRLHCDSVIAEFCFRALWRRLDEQPKETPATPK
jgi:hypothetical protein